MNALHLVRPWVRAWGVPPAIRLAPGEQMMWQGAPSWRGVARRVFQVRVVALYFAALLLTDMAGARLHHLGRLAALRAGLPVLLTAAAALAILAALAWGIGRTTRYTVTTRRVVMQFGLALPATLTLPLHRVAAASVRVRADHTGDISLRLYPGERIGYAKLWPHARPWRFGAPEPMLRDVPQAAAAVTLLCRLLAASAEARRRQPEPESLLAAS
jgi:hypothetical protein